MAWTTRDDCTHAGKAVHLNMPKQQVSITRHKLASTLDPCSGKEHSGGVCSHQA